MKLDLKKPKQKSLEEKWEDSKHSVSSTFLATKQIKGEHFDWFTEIRC